MSRPAKYESRAAQPIAVSLRLNREIAELAHELRDTLPGATATEKLQGVLTRALLRERDDAAIGTHGYALRALANGGFELVARVEDSRGLLRLADAGLYIEEGEPMAHYRTDTPTQLHNDQVLPPEPATTNAGSMGAADRARQQMMARDAEANARPWWSKEEKKGSEGKADADETGQLKRDGLDQQNPSADRAREAMLRRQGSAASAPGDFSKKG